MSTPRSPASLITTTLETFVATVSTTPTSTPTSTPLVQCSMRRVHHFDVPVHATCARLFRSAADDAATTAALPGPCGVWKDLLDNAAVVLPRIDGLSSTDATDFAILRTWFYVIAQYCASALHVNRFDVEMAKRAALPVEASIRLAESNKDTNTDTYCAADTDTLHANVERDDTLRVCADCPQICAKARREAYVQQARERTARACDRRVAAERHRPRRRTQRLYAPPDRSPMHDFDHALYALRFAAEVTRTKQNVTMLRARLASVRRAQRIAEAVRMALSRCLVTTTAVYTLVDDLVALWEHEITRTGDACAPLPPKPRREFQQRLKRLLLDLRTFMARPSDDATSVCPRHDGTAHRAVDAWAPWFIYQTTDDTTRAPEAEERDPSAVVLEGVLAAAGGRIDNVMGQKRANEQSTEKGKRRIGYDRRVWEW